MELKKQIKNLKENWLIILIIFLGILMLNNLSLFSISQLSSKAGFTEEFNEGYAVSDTEIERSIIPPTQYYGNDDFAPEIKERKITKSTQITNEIKRGKFYQEESTLKSTIKNHDAFILHESINKYGPKNRQSLTGTYSIKVPSANYELLISKLKQIGKVSSFTENTDDITGQYQDLEIELQAEIARLQKYNTLYNQAESTEEKLDLTDRIFNQERRVKYLEEALENQDKKIEYSTISLTLQEKQSDYINIALVTISDLIRAFVNSINSILKLIFILIPYILVIILIRYAYKKIKKH